MAYCLDDGKVDQESEFETELYNSLLKQLEEMKSDISDETLALIWLYLRTCFGKPVESLFMHKDLWNFDKKNFIGAVEFLNRDETIQDDAASLALKHLILNQLSSHDQCLKQWNVDLYDDVFKDLCSKCQIHNCQNCADSLNILIQSSDSIITKVRQEEELLSGKYMFHSMDESVLGYFPIYSRQCVVRDPAVVSGFSVYANFFLQRKKGYWCIAEGTERRHLEMYKISTTGIF